MNLGTELTIICGKWANPNPAMKQHFTAEHVNTLDRMLRRHLSVPYRLVCLTDDPEGIECDTIPIWDDYADLKHHPLTPTQVNCYRKMRIFDPTVAHLFGELALWMDLDVIILEDFAHLLTSRAPFVGWSPELPRSIWRRKQYSGSMFQFIPGHSMVSNIWTEFDFDTSPKIAKDAGFNGSDQAWMSYVLGEYCPVWTDKDGVLWYKTHAQPHLPDHASIVFFAGDAAPWHEEQQRIGWIKENWR